MNKRIILFIIAISISFTFFIYQNYQTIKKHSQQEGKQQITTLVQKINYKPKQNFEKIFTKKKNKISFIAKYNNLGTIAIFFDNYQNINKDWVWFRIKEKNTNDWYYQNKYNTDQFNPDHRFTFGFPIINKSKNREYIIEIESISGTLQNSVSFHSKSDNFLAKYSYPKSYLKEKPNQIIPFIFNKTKEHFNSLSKAEINKIIFKSIIPLLIFFLLIIKPIKYLKFIGKLKNNAKFNKVIVFLAPLIIFIITFTIAGFFSTIGTDPHHDGIMIKPSLDVSRGQMLFKDSFTQYGALTTIIQATAIKIFGEYLIVIKLTTAFFYALISVIMYSVWSKILNKSLSFLSCLILIFIAPYYVLTFLPWSSVYALFFECLTIYFVLKYLEKNNLKFIFWSGISVGLTFWCKQNVGGYIVFASLLSFILIKKLNNNKKIKIFPLIIKFIQGGIIISLPILTWIIINGAFIDWWKQSITFAFLFIEKKSSISLINSLFPASIGVLSIWTIMPIATIIVFLIEAFKKRANLILIVISIFSLFSWLQYYPVTCLRHVYWAATPMVGIIIYLFFKLSKSIFKNKNNLKYLFLFFLICLIFFPDIKYRIDNGLKKYNQNYSYLENPKILYGMKLTIDETNFYKKTYEEILNYKNKYGDVNLITTSPNALYLTFEKSKNFHPMYVNWGNSIYPDYTIIKDKYIKDNQPLIFSIWKQIPPGYCRFNDLVNKVDTSFLVAPCNKININN